MTKSRLLPRVVSFGGGPREAVASYRQSGVTRWIIMACMSLLLVALARATVAQTYKIPSSSMEPSLIPGDLVLVNRMCYGLKLPILGYLKDKRPEPQVGDMVVFYKPEDERYFVKRIWAREGDLVEERPDGLFVNDSRRIAYDDSSQVVGHGSWQIDRGDYFVVGDNLNQSLDSRSFGPITGQYIQGCPVLVYWSHTLDQDGTWNIKWSRIGLLLQ